MANKNTSLAVKYRPNDWESVMGQDTVKHILEHQVKTGTFKQGYLFCGRFGSGKALPLDADILGPDGYFKMRDAKVGMKVWGEDGKLHNIVGVYPQGVKEMYRIRFSDDTYTDCCADHLWTMRQTGCEITEGPHSWFTQSVRWLLQQELYTYVVTDIQGHRSISTRFMIPVSEPLQLGEQYLPVDPYLLGKFIANGSISEAIKSMGITISNEDFQKMFGGNHIPKEYLFSSIEQRTRLLQGLFDINGSINGNKYECSFVKTEFYDDIKFLIQSLGGLVDTTEELIASDSRANFSFQLPSSVIPFTTAELQEQYDNSNLTCDTGPYKFIIDIGKLPDAECQCIMTDNPTGLFLINDCIVTHNTTCARLFAKEINKGYHDIIEIDAATYNSVEQIRVIADEARKKPLVGDYKIFIIDECFSGNSLVRTLNGNVPIKDIQSGDKVYNLLGETIVKDIHHTQVSTDRLCCINTSNGPIVTTRDHLFFTQHGWIPAQELTKEDKLIDYASLQDMWKGFPGELSQRLQADLFRFLQNSVEKSEYTPEVSFADENLSRMWKSLPDAAKCECYNLLRSLWICISEASESGDATLRDMSDSLSMSYEEWETNLQSALCERTCSEEQSSSKSSINLGEGLRDLRKQLLSKFQQSSTKDLLRSLQEYVNIVIAKRSSSAGVAEGVYEEPQPSKSSGSDSKDTRYQTAERYIAYMGRESWWQWALYQSAINAISCAWEYSRIRVRNTDENEPHERISYMLQGRPRLSKISVSDRGGWQFPLIEIPTIIRSKENRASNSVRVDSVTFYEPGNRHQPEFSCFDNSELDSGSVTMYDLTIEGAPSYIVNDVLVHNCHMLSAAANNAFLKILEEPPATAIFILATTDPQKLLNTILSRVQRYDFTNIPTDDIVKRLKFIADSEKIIIDDVSIRYIAKLAEGGMRDAISMLDKCNSVSDNITLDKVVNALSTVSYHDHLDLLKALIDKDTKAAVSKITNAYEQGKDMKQFMNQFMWCVCDVCNFFVFDSYKYINIPELPEYDAKIRQLSLNDSLKVLEWVRRVCSQIRMDSSPKNAIIVEATLFTQNKE